MSFSGQEVAQGNSEGDTFVAIVQSEKSALICSFNKHKVFILSWAAPSRLSQDATEKVDHPSIGGMEMLGVAIKGSL